MAEPLLVQAAPKSAEHPRQLSSTSFLSLPVQPVASTHMCTHLMAAI